MVDKSKKEDKHNRDLYIPIIKKDGEDDQVWWDVLTVYSTEQVSTHSINSEKPILVCESMEEALRVIIEWLLEYTNN